MQGYRMVLINSAFSNSLQSCLFTGLAHKLKDDLSLCTLLWQEGMGMGQEQRNLREVTVIQGRYASQQSDRE
jgi:hypothetical protein